MDPLKDFPDRRELLLHWIRERHNVYHRKAQGSPKPWTEDPVLQKYRFCNVYRELDKVTKWIAQHWRGPHTYDRDVWFAMAVARYINLPETLSELGYPVPWSAQREHGFLQLAAKKRALGLQVFNGAYIIPTGGRKGSKAEYVATIFDTLWIRRNELRPQRDMTLATWHKLLTSVSGVGSFLGAQIVADTKYAQGPLSTAPDWHTFAAPGPGSVRGLNRVLGRPVNQRWAKHPVGVDFQTGGEFSGEWHLELLQLRNYVNVRLAKHGMSTLDAQDMQNCLCEFDKYCRVLLGEGRPKSLYPGV